MATKRVPTRAAAAPAASTAATDALGRQAAGGDHRHVDRLEHEVEQRQQPEPAADVPAGLDALGDDEVAAGVGGGARLVDRADLPRRERAAVVHQRDERRVRLAPEEVDERRRAPRRPRPPRGPRGTARGS